MLRLEDPANQSNVQYVYETPPLCHVQWVVHSRLDHSLASPEDGPSVGMHMVVLEGSGGGVPTAAV